MPKRFLAPIAVFCILLFNGSCILAQESKTDNPTKLYDFRIVQYISNRGLAPIDIMGLDNNDDILLACRTAKNKEQLSEIGIEIKESQIELLKLYNLLSEQDGIYKTAIPILGSNQTLKLRKYSKNVSKELTQILRPDIEELINDLNELGRKENSYSILFGYIFDGMVWDIFELKDLVLPNKVDLDYPLWKGEVYAFYPNRKFTCGRNSWRVDNYIYFENWSAGSMTMLSPFHKVIREIDDTTFLDILSQKSIEDEYWRGKFEPFGIINGEGQVTIPYIVENDSNKIYLSAKNISEKTVENLLNLVSFDEMKDEFGFRDIQQTIVIFYHELMWDMMDILEEQNIISKPAAFSDTANCTSKDLADLMFVVKKQ